MSMVSCNLKKNKKRNPDDFITSIKDGKVKYKFSGVYKIYSFRLRRHNTDKVDLFFNFRGLLRCFFSCILTTSFYIRSIKLVLTILPDHFSKRLI